MERTDGIVVGNQTKFEMEEEETKQYRITNKNRKGFVAVVVTVSIAFCLIGTIYSSDSIMSIIGSSSISKLSSSLSSSTTTNSSSSSSSRRRASTTVEMKEQNNIGFEKYEGDIREEEYEKEYNNNDDEEEDESDSCTFLCKSERLLFGDELVMSVSNEKEKLIQRVKIDYGEENFKKMFLDPSKSNNDLNVRSLFPGVDQSYERMKTKLILKIFKMQMRIIEQQQQNKNEQNDDDSCDCNNKGPQRQRKKHRSRDLSFPLSSSSNAPFMEKKTEDMLRRTEILPRKNPSNKYFSKFIFAVGGHSAAAGHGNFHEESYGRVLERSVKSSFASIGIDFTTRQYAMGGTDSASEVALCVDSIFGIDIDALSWDFGMTDGRNRWKMLLYAYHAGMQNPFIHEDNNNIHDNHLLDHIVSPVSFFAFNINREIPTVESIGHTGMPTFYQDSGAYKKLVKDNIPDTLGLSETEIQSMPEFVKTFKCGGALENGDPHCGDEKFNDEVCHARKFKTSWHPGWKDHGLLGKLISLFFVELLTDAVKEVAAMTANISSSSIIDRNRLFQELQSKEKMEYERFKKNEVPKAAATEIFKTHHKRNPIDSDLKENDQFDFIETWFKSRSFCHTALLPADIRYRNILTDHIALSTIDNRISNGYQLDYDMGTSEDSIKQQLARNRLKDTSNGNVQLVYALKQRQKCSIPLNIDHKDQFEIHQEEGLVSMQIPNNAEKSFYFINDGQNNRNNEPLKGIIMLCLVRCDWGKCPRGNINNEDIAPLPTEENPVNHKELLQIEINGVPVSSYSYVGGCHALKSEKIGYKWSTNQLNQYDIQIRILKAKSYLRISSIAII